MKRILVGTLAVALGLAACSDTSDEPLGAVTPSFSHGSSGVARVTNTNNAGPGSFRQAIQDANVDASIRRIEFKSRLGTIALAQSVVYSGTQSLAIEGNRATLDGHSLAGSEGIFVANGGGDLEISGITLREGPGVGITVDVPDVAVGTVKVSLIGVNVTDNDSHGVLINDQAEYFNDPNSTSPAGSAASLDVAVIGSSFERNGFTALDQDGLRINEGGEGNLRALISASRVNGNGGDGVEFDERGAGDVLFSVLGAALNRNGGFAAEDFDDGIDIDEAGEGNITGQFLLTSANENFEQGFDLNENDAGDIRVDMSLVEAIGNQQEGIEYEEDDDFAGGGDIIATLVGIKTRNNGSADGDAGLKLREKGAGNLNARLNGIDSSNNFVAGVLLREDADGDLVATIQNAITNANAGDGIEFDENSTGNLDASIQKATSSNNTVAGIRADQASPGTGTLLLVAVTTTGNGGGAVVANAGVVVTQ